MSLPLKVISKNRTETGVKANASTAKTDTGVGVAVAVNVVSIDNTAEIGTGAVNAGSLTVSAMMPEEADNETDELNTVKMVETRDEMTSQLAEYVKDGINDALSELGVDQSVIGELAAEFSETFVDYVLKETGLGDLLGDGDFDEKMDNVLGDLNDLWDAVKDYPAELLKPLTTLKDEIEALKKVDAKKLKAVLLDELKTQLPNLLKRTVTAVLNRAKDDIGTLMLGAVNCGLKGKDSPSIRDKAKKTVKNAVKAEWTLFSNKLLTQSLTRLRKEVPALTQQNIDRIKSAFTTSLDDKKEGFVDYLVDTFQDKVFNYTAVIDKITNTDFKAKAKEIMIGALNASTVKLADKAVASLVENLGEQLEVKSGAGATLEQDDSDADIVWITPEEGWKITAGKDKAAWSYTDYTSKTDDKKTDDKKSDPEKSGKLKVYSKVVNGETKYYIKASANKSVELYSAGFAVGGTVGVAVNAVVSVLKTNTTAELGGKASLTGDLNVKASGKRDVTSVGANLAAGAVGAGVNVQVLVAGEKMSQDAADMMTYGNSTSKGSQKTFDANALMENLSGTKDENGKVVKPALDNGGSKYYKDDVNGSVLAEDTAGNGHYESEQSAGGRGTSSGKSVGTFDATSGYRSGDFDNKSYNDGGETQRGENLKAKDTKDIQKAKAINTYSYSEAPSDAVIARITDTAMIEKARDVTVLASQPVSADLFGATVGGGAVGVGVSAAVAMLHSNVSVSSLGYIRSADGGVSVSVGAGAFALGAAVSQVNAKVNTLADRATLKATGTVEVFNDVISSSTPKVLSLAGGGLAAGGNVLLAFNETESRARVSGGSVNAAALNVVADLQGTAESKLTAAQAGGIAVGLSVNYADMRADNRAILENCAVNVKDLLVRTGRSSHDNTSAVANTVAGGMGFFALNMNAAIARNNAKNYAVIEGGNVTATKSLLVRGYDKATVDAGVEGVNAGYLSVAVNAVVALNDADTRAIVKLDKLNAGSATFEVFQKASADAKIVTGGGAMYKGDASVAVAYGRGSGVIDVDVKKLTASSVRAMNDTADAANATVSNGSYAAVKAAALIGAAYSQGVYDTKVKLGDGSSVSGNIDVTTDYGGRIKADVTPHKGGLDASLLKLGLSLASATSNGAKNVSFLTLGNLEARATASDSFNAALQGVTVNATGEALVRARANTKSDAYGGVPGGFSVVNGGRLVLNATAMGDAKSLVNSSSTGILLNVNSMKGENTFHEDVNLLVGDSVRLNADDVMFIYADGRAYMDAQSIYSGSFSVINEAAATAQNTLRRTQNVSIGRGAHLAANQIWISNYPGLAEKVNVKAEENTSSSAIEWVKSDAKNDVEITGVLSVGPAVRITGEVSVKITGEVGGEYNANAVINAREGLRLVAAPRSDSNCNVTIKNYVYINAGASSDADRMVITAKRDCVQVCAKLFKDMCVTSEGRSDADAVFGGVYAWGNVGAYIYDELTVDDTEFNGKNGTSLLTEHAGALISAQAYAGLHGKVGAGWESPTAKVWGYLTSVIKSNNTKNVAGGNKFTHTAKPTAGVRCGAHNTGSWWSVGNDDTQRTITGHWACDFCGRSNHGSGGTSVNVDVALSSAFQKALAPINDINRMAGSLGYVVKARYGEEDDRAAMAIYVLDVEVPLTKDATFGEDRLTKYRLWNNGVTQHDIFLLPNATRLYRDLALDYVSEVLRGDVRGDGGVYDIDIFTALNADAFRHPVIPVGSSGSLDFSTGTLTLPSMSDFELYLHEVSGRWLLDKLESGFIRRMDADQGAINAYVLDDDSSLSLPTGPIIETLAPDGEAEGWKRYWLGDTPETAADDDQTLVCLLHDEATDEVDAFRTTRAMIAAGEDPVDVSLYLFRDSKSDRRGEEKYNALFFDTPEGEKSLVKVITYALEGRKLEVPRSLRIALRGHDLGADWPVYSLTDHFFAMNDGTDGEVSMFDGFYQAVFDGDIFDSDYIRIEGILNNDLTVTVKQGQGIWPEWSGENAAGDIAGNAYQRVDGVWYNKDGSTLSDPLPDGAMAA